MAIWAIHIGCPKNCAHCSMVMAQKLRPRTHGQAAVHRFCTPMAPPQVTQEGEIIEFLAQIPSDTMIFITTAALGLAATLIGLRWLI
jgi:hypothetical protein